MARIIIASLLFASLVLSAGCKKDSPKKPSENGTAIALSAMPNKRTGIAGAAEECRKLCMIVGKCTQRDGKCLATSSEDCRASLGCKTAGLCEPKEGVCVATTNKHCEDSEICATQGRCVAVNGRCDNKNVMPDGSAKPAGSAK